MKAISLAYHDVVDGSPLPQTDVRPAVALYTVRETSFQQHLQSIAEGHAPVDVISGFQLWRNRTPVFLTFDDGAINAHCAADILEKQGWRGHFFITTNWIGMPDFLNRQQIRELRQRGHVIGSHSRSHPARMSHLTAKQLDKEWSDSCAILSDILGEPIKTASVPNGYYSEKVAQAAARAGIQVLFTSEATAVSHVVDGCLVLGRYLIRSNTPAKEVGALAAGSWWPRSKQALLWNTKKALKGMAGASYLKARRIFLSRLEDRLNNASRTQDVSGSQLAKSKSAR
jgi:peptidoglycan/xylan/chitin deacetylase (PgdA/CDA1 family)